MAGWDELVYVCTLSWPLWLACTQGGVSAHPSLNETDRKKPAVFWVLLTPGYWLRPSTWLWPRGSSRCWPCCYHLRISQSKRSDVNPSHFCGRSCFVWTSTCSGRAQTKFAWLLLTRYSESEVKKRTSPKYMLARQGFEFRKVAVGIVNISVFLWFQVLLFVNFIFTHSSPVYI